jgi:transcriptional regulator with PAS, ATPase and Fis domain
MSTGLEDPEDLEKFDPTPAPEQHGRRAIALARDVHRRGEATTSYTHARKAWMDHTNTRSAATPAWDRLARPVVHAPTSPLVAVLDSVQQLASSTIPVLVSGESGSGKEGIVRALHELSPSASGPFVPINCAAIPEALLESELFGHVRGAFTGADRARVGRCEIAAGGTLFLDEIGELPLALQAKMLRVVQEMEFIPVGGSTPKKATFRLVTATNRDLDEAVAAGSFRQDLLYRIDVVRLEVPPLRERPMDIGVLARHFFKLHAPARRPDLRALTDDAVAVLERYAWPGNVRELENLVQGLIALARREFIGADEVHARLRGRLADPPGAERLELPAAGLDLRATIEQLESDLIRQALRRSDGNKSQAASLLGLNRTTLVEKLKRKPVSAEG